MRERLSCRRPIGGSGPTHPRPARRLPPPRRSPPPHRGPGPPGRAEPRKDTPPGARCCRGPSLRPLHPLHPAGLLNRNPPRRANISHFRLPSYCTGSFSFERQYLSLLIKVCIQFYFFKSGGGGGSGGGAKSGSAGRGCKDRAGNGGGRGEALLSRVGPAGPGRHF